MAACATLLSLAGTVSSAQDLGGESAVAAGAPRRASRHRGPTPRRAEFAPLPECLGGLLATDERAPRHPKGHHGHGTEAGTSGLEPAATRQGLRPTGAGRLRNAVPRAQGHRHDQAGQGAGIDPGAPRGAGIMMAPTAVLILP